ncbi:protein EARLY-RESPONSIVE TO DEHYDRATION 7, chloroplastic-like [Mangifera indica]|uniref:protein EARLY-RESPONSIVE TO DEHYDRATION 7, chloroplastic-like n=1 Tax=Mangifera indica TaxID=29780 RepID=UPI001CFA5258|nr:protein EARLY-RESPONSIVE TO DEHYDRATION 7, chloroplastic-like [Mangifera indica]
MSSPNSTSNSLYPEVILSNPEAASASASIATPASSSLYPSVDMTDVAEKLFPENDAVSQTTNVQPSENLLVNIPGAIVHLIEREQSVELASGELSIVSLSQGDNVLAVFARIGDEIQWPLAKDEPAVKLDESHYFFTLRVPDQDNYELLNYGLTIATKGQAHLLKELDRVLETYSCFSVQKVRNMESWEVVAREMSPEELNSENNKEYMEKNSAAYWTTLAPNVEDYSGTFARMIAAGSGHLIKGILWCGDLTVDRLNWGNEFLRKRMGPVSKSEISPATINRIKRVKQLTKMSEKVTNGILSGVVKVSGFFTSSIVNSKVGKKFFSLLPGELVLATLDGFNKVCDAVELAGKNVMLTTSVVTTGLVSERYGEEAAKATNEGLDAAGHVIGAAWAVFKVRKALNPASAFKPTTLAKAAAKSKYAELKEKQQK